MSDVRTHVRVHVTFGEDFESIAGDFPAGENMWAYDLGDSRAVIDNVPFFAFDIAYGDIVEYTTDGEATREIVRVLERSGESTTQVMFKEDTEFDQVAFLMSLKREGIRVERANARHVAISHKPEQTSHLLECLKSVHEMGLLETFIMNDGTNEHEFSQ